MIRCLIIDDNSFHRKMVREAAKACSLEIELEEAADIATAERLLDDEQFDGILLDLQLPTEDGLSFAKRMLSSQPASQPFIMFTGRGSERLARDAFQLGILDYLSKADLSPESLELVITNAMTKIRLLRERQAAVDELKRSNEALSRFASIVAHDLKAPIRRMKTFSSFLSEDHGDDLGDDGRKLLDRIERGADRAAELIDGMLTYARLDKEAEERTEVGLRSAVDDAIANLADLIEESDPLIEIGDLPTVVGIAPQLMQLFQNLISNALKFRHLDRQPVIRIKAEPAEPGACRIAIEDNGIGIAPEDQERVFEMLERLHPQDRYEGSGIGLATCKRIAENHGGRIWCRTGGDIGSTFVFTLDLGNKIEARDGEPQVESLQAAAS